MSVKFIVIVIMTCRHVGAYSSFLTLSIFQLSHPHFNDTLQFIVMLERLLFHFWPTFVDYLYL